MTILCYRSLFSRAVSEDGKRRTEGVSLPLPQGGHEKLREVPYSLHETCYTVPGANGPHEAPHERAGTNREEGRGKGATRPGVSRVVRHSS
jgi:hypothetical protein